MLFLVESLSSSRLLKSESTRTEVVTQASAVKLFIFLMIVRFPCGLYMQRYPRLSLGVLPEDLEFALQNDPMFSDLFVK